MKERIQKFIDYKNISPGNLSEILGVQRSNISHILNGRNKPGAAFIEKLLIAFPILNARWLLTGEGPMISEVTEITSAGNIKSSEPVKEANPSSDKVDSSAEKHHPKAKNKALNKLVLLYTDGTFTTYDPA
jgi:transcriptional regulator with XRE-family HTH domain